MTASIPSTAMWPVYTHTRARARTHTHVWAPGRVCVAQLWYRVEVVSSSREVLSVRVGRHTHTHTHTHTHVLPVRVGCLAFGLYVEAGFAFLFDSIAHRPTSPRSARCTCNWRRARAHTHAPIHPSTHLSFHPPTHKHAGACMPGVAPAAHKHTHTHRERHTHTHTWLSRHQPFSPPRRGLVLACMLVARVSCL